MEKFTDAAARSAHSFAKYANEWGTHRYLGHPAGRTIQSPANGISLGFAEEMMTKAEKFLNSLGIIEDVSDGELVNKARVAAGREPEIFSTLDGKTRELYFHFDDDSILNVDLIDPGRRRISVLIRRKD